MNALETINQARDALTVRRVYGDPYQEEGVTVIPAAHVMGGGGGGGDAQWRPAIDLNRTIFMGQLVAIVALLTARSIVKSVMKRR